jgi:hypothetical protein
MYVKAAKLFRVTRGIYSINPQFQPAALAAKLNPPSYITGWYVLSRAGVVYQYYGEGVTSVALRNRQFEIAGQKYSFRQMKREIFFNELGIEKTANYWIASPERALLDVLYFNKSLSFDHLDGLDFAKAQAIGKIYGQNNLLRRLEELFGKENS